LNRNQLESFGRGEMGSRGEVGSRDKTDWRGETVDEVDEEEATD